MFFGFRATRFPALFFNIRVSNQRAHYSTDGRKIEDCQKQEKKKKKEIKLDSRDAHKFVILFSIDCIDPDNAEASSVTKIHLCFVLCYTVHRFSIFNLLAWTLTWGNSARHSRRQREAEGTWGSPCPPENCMEVTALPALRSLPPARLEADSCWGKRKEEKRREKRWSQFRFLSKGCRCFSKAGAWKLVGIAAEKPWSYHSGSFSQSSLKQSMTAACRKTVK